MDFAVRWLIFNDFSKNWSQNTNFWSVRPKELCFLPVLTNGSKFYAYNYLPLSAIPVTKIQNFPADVPPNHFPIISKTDLHPLLMASGVTDGEGGRVSPQRLFTGKFLATDREN